MVLEEDLTARIVADKVNGVQIDISALDGVDSFIGRMISNTAPMARELDALTVGWVSSQRWSSRWRSLALRPRACVLP